MSFRILSDPRQRFASRFIARVRDELMRALMVEKSQRGLTQAELARKLGVNRSVINKELSGKANLTLRRVAELAWALDCEVSFSMDKAAPAESISATSTDLGRTVNVVSRNRSGDPLIGGRFIESNINQNIAA